MISAGSSFGNYQIVSRLGAGGMGEVYRAKDLRLGRDVAIKVLSEQFVGDREAVSRFEREARALAALSHPNILTIYDFKTESDITFAVMELLEGETLRNLLDRGVLSWQRALEISVAIAEGLAAAHSRGVIHRDLKPENIFLTADNIIKILDFGLARVERPINFADQDDVSTMWTTATRPGTIMGTIPYMSPEQVRGEAVDPRSDIFSFGSMLYEMLTGNTPFYCATMVDTMAAILKDSAPQLSRSGIQILPAMEGIIQRCLEKRPAHRYQTARELLQELKEISNSSGSWQSGSKKDSSMRRNSGRRAKKGIDSLAILPFVNEGNNPNTEYLSDGITETLINTISQLPKLRVMARSTVFRYKNQTIDPQTLGRELNVRAVLTGRIVQRGETLNIQTELVDVSDGSQIWGEQFKRPLSDIFALQDELSEQISDRLRIKLSGEEKKKLNKRFTENTEAYQLYLKGRHFWNKRTVDQIKKGIDFFQQAIDIDPNYALAYAGLADSYNILGSYEVFAPHEAFPKARAAATRALELDESLAEAHTSLALIKHRYEFDWRGAEREFKRAIELNQNYATAHHWYSSYLDSMGRFEEAITEAKRAQELDPLSLIIILAVGAAYFYAGDYDRALAQYQHALDMDENFAPAHYDMLRLYMVKGMPDKAILSAQKAMGLTGEKKFADQIGEAYQSAGTMGVMQKWLSEYLADAEQSYSPPYTIASLYTGLGDYEEAFKWLEKAYQARSHGIVWLRFDPVLKPLRTDPRFADLVRRLNFPNTTV